MYKNQKETGGSIITLQLFSSSAFTIMVPHFFPWMPLFTTDKHSAGLDNHRYTQYLLYCSLKVKMTIRNNLRISDI